MPTAIQRLAYAPAQSGLHKLVVNKLWQNLTQKYITCYVNGGDPDEQAQSYMYLICFGDYTRLVKKALILFSLK